MKETTDYYAQVNGDVISIKLDIQRIARYFKNDFDEILNDGTVTKEDLKIDMVNLHNLFSDINQQLNDLQIITMGIMSEFINK